MKKTYFLLFLLIFFSVHLFSQDWKVYPYHQEGTYIYFPADEGVHPAESSEWWYLIGHLTGENTGNYYTIMLTYFHNPYAGFDGFRIFNLTNETDDLFFPQTLPVYYDTLAQDSLKIYCDPIGAPPEWWVNKTNDDGTMMPFQYNVKAKQNNGAINLSLDTYKRPLIVGDSGYFFQGGQGNYTYYYSQTGINITGTITFNGTTEPVEGIGWIDRQYGTFNPSTGENYEWFSVQLDNGMDINFWNIFTSDNMVPDTATYQLASFYFDDLHDTAVVDFQLTRLKYSWTEDSSGCYAQQWRFMWNNIDLTMTTLSPDRIVELPFEFYEGALSITGTVDGTDVSGVGFAELLHSYEIPELDFLNPDTTAVWAGTGDTIAWEVLNPDDGDPLYYTLDYSIDGGESWEQIADGITGTSWYWDFSDQNEGAICFFRLTGSSVDGTITKTIFSDSVTLHIVSGIDNPERDKFSYVYPNPSQGIFYVYSKNIRNIVVMDVYGNIIMKKNVQPNLPARIEIIDLSGEKPGIYLLKISNDNVSRTYKLILDKP